MEGNGIGIWIGYIGSGVAVIAGAWFGFRKAVEQAGQKIAGNDFFERLDAKLDTRFGKAEELLSQGIDLLNPKTNGGAGNPPEQD